MEAKGGRDLVAALRCHQSLLRRIETSSQIERSNEQNSTHAEPLTKHLEAITISERVISKYTIWGRDAGFSRNTIGSVWPCTCKPSGIYDLDTGPTRRRSRKFRGGTKDFRTNFLEFPIMSPSCWTARERALPQIPSDGDISVFTRS